MIPCDFLSRLEDEPAISMHFPITHLISPSVFETKNGALGSVIHLKGVAFDTENNEVLNRFKQIWHQSILGLSEDFSIYVTHYRRKASYDLSGNFNQDFLREIDSRYHAQFRKDSTFLNELYLSVMTRGLVTKKLHSISKWASSISSKSIQDSYEWGLKRQRIYLESAVRQLLISLAEFSPTLLGSQDQIMACSELLGFLSLFINGDKNLVPSFIYPSERLASYLARYRLFFSNAIEFQRHDTSKKRFAAMVSIKKYANETSCRSMDPFLQMDCEYISTNSFFLESKDRVQRLINQHRRKLKNVNDLGKSQLYKLSDAQDKLAGDRIVMGVHHNTLMLIEESLEQLDQNVAKAIKCYSDAGFVAIRETLGQEAAFWGQIPGNAKMIARSSLIGSENFVDFCPLHNYRSGYCNQNHLGSAVTLLKTPSNTPFFFNFHTEGSSDNPSKGHTTIVGGNGSGKTVLMAFLDAQVSRYSGRSFVFDRDRGLEIYLRACGGYYAVLSPECPNSIRFNPFQLADTSINRKFCREWLGQLIKEEDELVLPSDLLDTVAHCVEYVFEALRPKDRRLTNAAKLLPINFSRWPHLRRWLRSDGVHPEGEYAYLFDNSEDDFQMQDKMGFDMTHFLDAEPRSVLVALTMYLFHRLESSFDGRLITVLLDEGWQYLDNPYWTQKLKKWLPTLRKLNCHLVLATQSPASVIESPIRSRILDNVATQIYFPNPQAMREHYLEGFNLTESEYRCVKENDPSSRYFLLKQENESTLCQLDLSEIRNLLPIFSANRSTLRLLDELREKYGDDPKDWLLIFRERVS